MEVPTWATIAVARQPDTPCSSCGVLMWSCKQYPPGTPGRTCLPCRRAANAQLPEPSCGDCGQVISVPEGGRRGKYCLECRDFRSFTCEFCGDAARSHRWDATRFCSLFCAQRHLAGWSSSTEIVPFVPPPKPRKQPPPPPKRTDWWTFLVSGPCARCGESFTARATDPDQLPKYCSDRCGRRAWGDVRRARKRGAYVADVNRRQIFERDRWRCQLCGKAVNRRAVVPHPKAPVIDHIIPLGANGTHEPSNAQCAHFLCNSIKSDGAANDQLRLIG